MDRLTEFHGGIWGMSTKAVEKGYDRYSVFSKLAEFENLEVTPEQIREIDKLYAEKCRELAGGEEYIKWLENMTILLAKCYQETHDMLLQKAKSGNKAYFEMPTVQGFSMVMSVDKISKKAVCHGDISEEKLEGYVNYLIENNHAEAKLAEMEGGNE